jgi:hypothetical protein
MKKLQNKTTLHVIAIAQANVREIEPNGAVLPQIRFVGKQYNIKTDEWELLVGGVVVPYSVHIIQELKNKSLLPGDQATATLAGVPLPTPTN